MDLAREKTCGNCKVSHLEDRETPAEQEYQAFSKQMVYWQARYPFPFQSKSKPGHARAPAQSPTVTLIRQESQFEPKVRSVAGALA